MTAGRRRVRLPRPPRRLAAGLDRVPRSLLPGALTIGNLLMGYAAILAATQFRFRLAAVLIFGAAVFDALDGRIARLAGATSEIGEELDSLCDAVSFAVAPSMLVFHAGVAGLGRVGWAVCFLFAACGVIRLARFNVLPSDHHHFVGLPIPLAAAAIVTPVLLADGHALRASWVPWQALLTTGIALLMVSRVPYRTFKDVDIRRHANWLLPLWIMILAAMLARHEVVVPGLIFLYLVSPVVFGLLSRARAARGRRVPVTGAVHRRAVRPGHGRTGPVGPGPASGGGAEDEMTGPVPPPGGARN